MRVHRSSGRKVSQAPDDRIRWRTKPNGPINVGPKHCATVAEQRERIALWAKATGATPLAQSQAMWASWPAMQDRAERAVRYRDLGAPDWMTTLPGILSPGDRLPPAVFCVPSDEQRRQLAAIIDA